MPLCEHSYVKALNNSLMSARRVLVIWNIWTNESAQFSRSLEKSMSYMDKKGYEDTAIQSHSFKKYNEAVPSCNLIRFWVAQYPFGEDH